MSLPNAIVFNQSKGGCGKSSLAANVSGLAAAAGQRVLMVDLDGQAHLGMHVGVQKGTGKELYDALTTGSAPVVLEDVRPNLSLMAGGIQVNRADKLLPTAEAWGAAVDQVLAPFASEYDLIMIDTPPRAEDLVAGSLMVADNVIVPVDADAGTADGTSALRDQFILARETNPSLNLLGVVMFGFGLGDTVMRRDTRAEVNAMFGADPLEAEARVRSAMPVDPFIEFVFRAVVRDARVAGKQARKEGWLIQEIADASARRAGLWVDHLRLGKPTVQNSSNASGLLDDYVAITRELLERATAIRAAVAA